MEEKKAYISWLWQYTKPFLPQIGILLFCSFATSLITVGTAILSKQIIDSAISGGFIKTSIVIYVGMILASQAVDIISQMLSVMLDERFSFGVRKQVYEKIIHSQWSEVKKYHTGDLMTRLTSDAGNVANGIIYVIPTIIRLFLELLLTFFTLFYYEKRLAIFAVVLGPVATLSSVWLGRHLKKLTVKVQESEAEYRSFLQESMANLLIIKSFANEDYASERFANLRDERFFWVWKKTCMNLVVSSVMSFTFHIGYLVAFTFGAMQVSAKIITYGTMSVFLTLVNRIQAPIVSLGQQIPKVVSILASAGRVMELQNISEEEWKEISINQEQIGVSMEHIRFGYTNELILEDTSVRIRPGEFVAIVGESGIGKTTLIRLILSFMQTSDGAIFFYNTQGQKVLSNAQTRKFMSYVPQGNSLFSGTIRENIRMGKLDATEEEMIEALKLSSAYEFVKELPQGMDTIVGERGHGISEGQSQRIAIARALVRKAPFLILDEATSSLDEKTELSVLKGIQKLTPRPTCLLITHRRVVLSYCDREIQIQNRKILEV